MNLLCFMSVLTHSKFSRRCGTMTRANAYGIVRLYSNSNNNDDDDDNDCLITIMIVAPCCARFLCFLVP